MSRRWGIAILMAIVLHGAFAEVRRGAMHEQTRRILKGDGADHESIAHRLQAMELWTQGIEQRIHSIGEILDAYKAKQAPGLIIDEVKKLQAQIAELKKG